MHWNGLTQNEQTMTAKRATEILLAYNVWRRGDHEPCDFEYSALELGAAIDMAALALLRTMDNTNGNGNGED